MGFLSSLFKLIIPIAGFALFGPIGFFAGSLVGSLLFPNKQPSQPAPQNIKVQTSTYGTTIPIVWGRYRLAGNIIWSTDIRNVRIPGAKSGFLFWGSKSPDINYYAASWAIVFCEGPVEAITRIWFDGLEVYDVRETTPETYRAKSTEKLGRDYDGIQIYLGTETQTADPLILADADVPDTDLCAYRGLVYIVFNNWNLSNFGSRIPNVTAEIVTEATETFSAWVDRSVETLPAVTQHAACVALDRLYIGGGYKWDGSTFDGVSDFSRATLNSDGTLSWTSAGTHPGGKIGEFELVYWPEIVIGWSARVYAFGGYDWVNDCSYYQKPDEGSKITNMQSMIAIGVNENWYATRCTGSEGGYTQGRIPFPRDSFAACFHFAQHPFLYGVWLYGGKIGLDDNYPELRPRYEGDGSMYRDLWFFNGLSWQILTEITVVHPPIGADYYVSEDGGAGYRHKHSMYSFRGTLFLAGGLDPTGTPLRDVYKLVIGGVNYARFTPICLDVMADFPGNDKLDYYITGLSEWRGTLLAFLAKMNAGLVTDQYYVMQSRDMGVTWEILQRADYEIVSTGVGTGGYGYYLVSGDQTEVVAAGDRMTIIGTTDFEESIIVAVELTGGNTRLYYEWLSEPTIAAGTVYIHAIGGTIQSTGFEVGKLVQFENFQGILFMLGGSKEYVSDDDPPVTTYGLQIYKADTDKSYLGTVKLSDIIYDLCIRAGLDDGEINVEDLQDVEIYGFAAYQTIRESIEQLRQFGFFDVVETEGQVKFVLRGGSAAAALTTDDLAAHPSGQETPSMIEYSITQDMELPQELDIVYPDVDLDYNENTQIAHRLTTESNKIETLNAAIVMDADKAAQMAYVLLYDAWNSRTALTIAVSREFLYLDPGDVITITPVAGGTVYTCRIDQISYETNGIIKIQAIIENIDLYTAQITGSHGQGVTYNPIHLKDLTTTAFFLDIPIIGDRDDEHGFYFAAAPAATADEDDWQGAILYHYTAANENPYAPVGEVREAIYHGTCGTTLGDIPSPTWWDNLNTLDVTMTIGTLETITDDQIKDGQNMAVVGSAAAGWEIIQFQTATDLGSGSYRLSKLQRGMFGTDWKIDGHAAGETFVLLEYNKLARVNMTLQDVNRSYQFVVTPLGRYPEEYTPASFTCAAVGKKPYSPVHLEAHKMENGDWKLEWMRRSRGIVSLFGGLQIPINETQSHGVYEIDFLDPATDEVLHIEEIDILSLHPDNKPYFTLPVNGYYYYSGGKQYFRYGQTEIFGAAVDTLKVRICQISETVGRGYTTEATFTV